MIGTKFKKSDYDQAAYTAAAEWCNANNAYIKDSGDYYEVVAVPEPTLNETRAAKLTELKATRDELEAAAVTTTKGTFDFDDKSRERLDIAYKALVGSTGTIDWTLADNTVVTLAAADINDVFLAAAARSNTLHEKYRTLKETVEACTTNEAVAAVVWG